MGIKSLNKLLQKHCPNSIEHIHISEYAFQKVAVDLTLYLGILKMRCKMFLKDPMTCKARWLAMFIEFVACLRKNQVHCVFIYDSGCPDEKLQERQERADAREKTSLRAYELEDALREYKLTGIADPILLEFSEKVATQRLLVKPEKVNVEAIERKIDQLRSNILEFKPEDFTLTKEIFDILRVPWFQAPLEAETMCSDLCRRGLVSAAMSEDTDVLAYGSPVFLSKLNTKNASCFRIVYDNMLEELDIVDKSFLDLCIMCGTDYNKNIYKVGPEKSYNLIRNYSTIEGVSENTDYDVSVLNYTRGRELFREYKQSEITSVPFCGTPDFDRLESFIFKHNIGLDINSLRNSFTKRCVVFEGE